MFEITKWNLGQNTYINSKQNSGFGNNNEKKGSRNVISIRTLRKSGPWNVLPNLVVDSEG